MNECLFRERPVIKYLYRARPKLTSCPTCGRCQARDQFYDIAHQVEEAILRVNTSAHVAIMGCEVNGPGEAKDADIGVACGKGKAALFERGQIVKSIPLDRIVDEILDRLPYLMIDEGAPRRVSWRCWANASYECTFPGPVKPCFSTRETKGCPHAA